jgi:hypothetical protein
MFNGSHLLAALHLALSLGVLLYALRKKVTFPQALLAAITWPLLILLSRPNNRHPNFWEH